VWYYCLAAFIVFCLLCAVLIYAASAVGSHEDDKMGRG